MKKSSVNGDMASTPDQKPALYQKHASLFWTAILLGIGIAAFLDETILHQLLQWHTFYWNTDQRGRILSDGLFHALSTLLLLWATLRLWRTRWNATTRSAVIAVTFIGVGAFNLYDGLVQHAILHFHLVNELVYSSSASQNDTVLGICRNDLPYELVFDSIALIILIVGIAWWYRARRALEEDRQDPIEKTPGSL